MRNVDIKHISLIDYFLVLLLLFMSGNIAFSYYVTKWCYVIFAFLMIVIYLSDSKRLNRKIGYHHVRRLLFFILCLVILFVCQTVVLGWNSFSGIVNFLCKIIVGGGVVLYLRERFKYALFNIMYYISIVCLIFWCIQLFTGPNMGLLPAGREYQTAIIFHTRLRENIRNCGFFWEPGAYGGYLVLLLLLFYNDLAYLFKCHRGKCVVLLIALISTMSTTAYIVFGLTLIWYFSFKMKNNLKYILLPLSVGVALWAYYSFDFLSTKIDRQTIQSLSMDGEYSSNRLGSLLFDLHYIQKHPLVGNGLHERTRYADHMYVFEMISSGEVANTGNGFSESIVKFGFLFWGIFIYFLFTGNKKVQKPDLISFVILFCVLLNGEMFFNYPLALSIPMMRLATRKKRKKVIISLMVQKEKNQRMMSHLFAE